MPHTGAYTVFHKKHIENKPVGANL